MVTVVALEFRRGVSDLALSIIFSSLSQIVHTVLLAKPAMCYLFKAGIVCLYADEGRLD